MDIKQYIREENQYLMHTYSRLPIVFVRGEGSKLWDIAGKEYLDFVSGLGVLNIGHSHSSIVKAVTEQVRKLVHVSNLFYTLPQIELARMLTEGSFADKCFFANSGAEANEAAIKLARKYAKVSQVALAVKPNGRAGRPGRKAQRAGRSLGANTPDSRLPTPDSSAPFEIITTLKGFHGRTLATLAATGQPEKQKAFEPMPVGFKHVPFNDIDAMSEAIDEKTCAIMVEPIQGEGGVNVASPQYLQELRHLCDKHGLLLILDEVQTGLGRTGKMFAYQHYNIEPDLMTLAKGLGNGFPIGALLAKEDVAAAFEPGDHATTFGGGPLVCSAAIATLKVIEAEKLVENCAQMGDYLRRKLEAIKNKTSYLKEIRGKGLMIGLQFDRDCAKEIVYLCLDKGIVVNNVAPNVVRLLPPLCISKEEVDRAVEVFGRTIKKVR